MKKQLSVFLFGALLLGAAGTFTSCKDYDDDITNLQGQIDGQASDLQSKLEGVNSAISSLQSAQSGVQSAIDEAKTAAEAAAAAAQAAAIEAAKAQLESVKAELEAAIAASTGDIEELKAAVETAVAEAIGRIETLESFQTNTETTLKDLQDARTALQASVDKLNKDMEEHGRRLAAIEAQIEALNHYNDSINADVNGQIDDVRKQLLGLDSLEEAVSKVDSLLAAYKVTNDAEIESLKKQLADALATLGSDDTGLQGEVAALKEQLDALKNGQLGDMSGLTDEIVKKVEEALLAEGGEISKLNDKIDLLSQALGKKVTHVSLYAATGKYTYPDGYDFYLDLSSVEAVRTGTFGEGMTGAVQFTKGEKETFEDDFLLRVSPVNANLDMDDIKLVDSKLNSLKGLVDIVKLEPYDNLLVDTRAVSPNGLWKVTVKLADNYDEAAYDKAVGSPNNANDYNTDYILYAVMVGDSAKDERQVVSEYGLTLSRQANNPVRVLDYYVDYDKVKEDGNIMNIRNRWGGGDNTYTENGGTVTYKELAWKNKQKQDHGDWVDFYAPYAELIYGSSNPDNDNAEPADGNNTHFGTDAENPRNYPFSDARISKMAWSVKAGTPFTVSLSQTIVPSVRAFYVTLDEQCAVESAPSELNAWKSYNIQGLNTVIPGASVATLTIPESAHAEGDYIGFRVYAVNYDGSLVDPDGRAFYVYVGEVVANAAEVTLSIKGTAVSPLAETLTSTRGNFSTETWGRANQLDEFEIVDSEGNEADIPSFIDVVTSTKVYDANNKPVDWIVDGAVNANIRKIELVNIRADELKDNETYTLTIYATNRQSGAVAVGKVTFKKQLPGFPDNITPFTNMLVDNTLTVYPYKAEAGNNAVYDMNSAWHGLDGAWSGNLSLVENVAADKRTVTYADQKISAPAAAVNPKAGNYKAAHPMRFTYNYGDISLVENQQTGTWEIKPWKRTYDFTLKLANYVKECTFTADKTLKVVYPGAADITVPIPLDNFELTDPYGQPVYLVNLIYLTGANANATTTNPEVTVPTEDEAIENGEIVLAPGQTLETTKEARYFDPASPLTISFVTGTGDKMENEFFEPAANAFSYDAKDGWCINMTSKSAAAMGGVVPTKVRITVKDKFGYEIALTTANAAFDMTYGNEQPAE